MKPSKVAVSSDSNDERYSVSWDRSAPARLRNHPPLAEEMLLGQQYPHSSEPGRCGKMGTG